MHMKYLLFLKLTTKLSYLVTAPVVYSAYGSLKMVFHITLDWGFLIDPVLYT